MEKYDTFKNKVVDLDSYIGGGIAEVIDEDEKTLTVHWIYFNPCYSQQIYSEEKYTKPETLYKEYGYEMSVSTEEWSKDRIEKERQAYKEYDAPMYERYAKLIQTLENC